MLNNYTFTIILNYTYIIINIITGFILFPLIIKYLGLEALGVFAIFYTFKSLIDMATNWFSSSITKALFKYKHIKNSIITLSFIINIIYGILGFFAFVFYGYLFEPDYLYSTIYFGIFIIFSFNSVPYYEILLSKLEQSQVALFKVIQQGLFSITAIGFFIYCNEKSLDIIFLMLAISSLVSFLLIIIYFNFNHKIVITLDKINKKFISLLIISNGIKYFFNSATTIILLQIDVLLIGYFYGKENVGIYLIVWKIPNTIIMLGWRLSEPFYAIVGKNVRIDRDNVLKQFYKLERKILLLSILGGLTYIFFGSFILNLWLDGKNIPSIEYMYIIPACVVVLSIMQRLYLSCNYYTTGLNLVSKLQFFEIIMKIIFTVFLFKYINVLAPILGWLVAFVFTIFIYRNNGLKVLQNV